MSNLNLFLECLWKTSAVTVLVWLLTLVLRQQSAAIRHGLWICSLTGFLVVPAMLPLARRTPPVRVAFHMPAGMDVVQVQVLPAAPGHKKRSSVPGSPLPQRYLPEQLFLGTWMAGSLVLLLRRGRAALRMKGIADRSQPATAEIASLSDSEVRISDEVRTPLTWGVRRPVILLPTCALDWRPDCLHSVLEHEGEHIRRLDPLSHWFGELVCAAWWCNPFAWLARGRAAHERECACDDAVLRSGVRPSDYAFELVNLAATLPIKGEPIMALSALSDFERRIKNLLLPGIDRRPSTMRARLAVTLASVVLIVPLALLRAQAPVGQGDLSGTVFDPSGAVVPNVDVMASGSTGNRELTRSDLAGKWSLTGIPAGDYTVEFRAHGFAMTTKTITLTPGQRATLNHSLAVGSVDQTINVVAQGQARHTELQSGGTGERIRVGGNVQATNLIRQVKPMYPAAARAQGIEGTVLMKAIIGKDGNLLSLAVINTLVDPDLAAAALAAAQQWRYRPTLLNGEPVEVVTTITMNFKLE